MSDIWIRSNWSSDRVSQLRASSLTSRTRGSSARLVKSHQVLGDDVEDVVVDLDAGHPVGAELEAGQHITPPPTPMTALSKPSSRP